MRMRKKKNLKERMERCGALLEGSPESRRGTWRELLPGAKELRLELGCGKGRFTCETAASRPDVLFVAMERVPDAMVTAMERAAAAGLRNVFFIDADASGLDKFFAPGEVDLIYVNFCDPWPSRKHARRRLTSGGFLALYRDLLRTGGQIHFKTDNAELFRYSLLQFPAADFLPEEVTDNVHGDGVRGVMTDYEEKFHGQGIPIHRCVAVKLPQSRQPEINDAP
jgi:tRNA (guanine-N7-)-methyltransferase